MDDKALYQLILGIYSPWRVEGVAIDPPAGNVIISVGHDPDIRVACPRCGTLCTYHDHAPKRQWRHLDTCQYRTVVEAATPRADCPTHGPLTIHVPWAEQGSRYTALFEAAVLIWLREASIKSVGQSFRLTWDSIDGIMQRGVKRGLARRKLKPVTNLGIDEKAFQKHHRYSTILLDKDTDTVIDVLEDRRKETLHDYLVREKALFSQLKTISMDMWDPYIAAFLEFDPTLKDKISFDRYHVAAHFSKGVDQVRADEHRELQEKKDDRLKYTRFDWLFNGLKIDNRSRSAFMRLARSALRTARAWAMKETAAGLWSFKYKQAAENAWMKLSRWMMMSRLKPMIKLAKMIRNYLWGIINATVSGVTNAASESKNAVVQKIKARACGFRNRLRFRNAILFHLGGLDMAPRYSLG